MHTCYTCFDQVKQSISLFACMYIDIGVGTMGGGGGGGGNHGRGAIAPPPNILYSSQCLPGHIHTHIVMKLLYCT